MKQLITALLIFICIPLFSQDDEGRAVKPFLSGSLGHLNNTAVSIRAGAIGWKRINIEAGQTWSAEKPFQTFAKAGYIFNAHHNLQFIPLVGVAHYWNGQQDKRNNYASAIAGGELGFKLDGRDKNQGEINHFVFFVDYHTNVFSETSSSYIGAFGLRIVFD